MFDRYSLPNRNLLNNPLVPRSLDDDQDAFGTKTTFDPGIINTGPQLPPSTTFLPQDEDSSPGPQASFGRPLPGQFADVAPKPPSFLDQYNAIAGNRPKRDELADLIANEPKRENFRPGKLDRWAAALSGMSAGSRDAGEGVKVARGILDRPFNDAEATYQDKLRNVSALAGLEGEDIKTKLEGLKTSSDQSFRDKSLEASNWVQKTDETTGQEFEENRITKERRNFGKLKRSDAEQDEATKIRDTYLGEIQKSIAAIREAPNPRQRLDEVQLRIDQLVSEGVPVDKYLTKDAKGLPVVKGEDIPFYKPWASKDPREAEYLAKIRAAFDTGEKIGGPPPPPGDKTDVIDPALRQQAIDALNGAHKAVTTESIKIAAARIKAASGGPAITPAPVVAPPVAPPKVAPPAVVPQGPGLAGEADMSASLPDFNQPPVPPIQPPVIPPIAQPPTNAAPPAIPPAPPDFSGLPTPKFIGPGFNLGTNVPVPPSPEANNVIPPPGGYGFPANLAPARFQGTPNPLASRLALSRGLGLPDTSFTPGPAPVEAAPPIGMPGFNPNINSGIDLSGFPKLKLPPPPTAPKAATVKAGTSSLEDVPTYDFNKPYQLVDVKSGEKKMASKPVRTHSEYEDLINAEADKRGVDPELIHAIIRQESRYNPNAKSKTGAVGLMQLMPATAKNLGVKDSSDPKQNIKAGVKLISDLMKKYNDNIPLVLSAYNRGEPQTDKWVKAKKSFKEMPKETQDYLNLIMRNYNFYKSLDTGDNSSGKGR